MIGMMRPFYQAHWDISKDIKHVWLLICTYYIAWIFQWILSGEGRGKWWDRQYRVWIPQCAAPLDVTVTYARDSFVDSPSVLRPGWHMQETAFVDSQGGLLSSRGGAQTHWHRHIGTSLTVSQYCSFYCIFDQINAALVCIRNVYIRVGMCDFDHMLILRVLFHLLALFVAENLMCMIIYHIFTFELPLPSSKTHLKFI